MHGQTNIKSCNTQASKQCKAEIYKMYLKTKIDFQYQNEHSSEVRQKKKSKMQETYTISEM
jgi:hypothetical protein